MKIVHFEAVGGASGDMILGALIGLGADPAKLETALRSMPVEAFAIRTERVNVQGITGLRATVDLQPAAQDHGHAHSHRHHREPHGHHHDHDHDHGPAHTHAHAHDHHGPHRHLPGIEALIRAGTFPDAVKERSLAVFGRLADAEAEVHGIPRDHVHFHEVGALDSIIDITGCCLALQMIGAEGVSVGPLPQGRGTIVCAHGTYPNPAPATLLLLRGSSVEQTDEPFELVTPTGAALLTTWRTLTAPPPGSRVLAVAHSFGQRTLAGRPNLLRATLLETAEAADDRCLVLETNIDDATPETIGAAFGALLEAGALDVFCTPVQMKKQRPGVLLTVLCAPALRARMLDVLFAWTPTFGIREHEVRREVLDRRHVNVDTPFGPVRVKIGARAGRDVVFAPEYEDCLAAARAAGAPFPAVYDAARRAAGGPG